MTAQIDAHRLDWFKIFSKGTVFFSVLVGCMVLIGWVFNIAMLKTVLPGLASMKPITALSFLLLGTSFWILQNRLAYQRVQWIGQVCAGLVVLIGILTMSQYLLIEAPFKVELFATGQMSFSGTVNFSLLGTALYLLFIRQSIGTAQILTLIALLVAMLALVGYLYDVPSLYSSGPFSTMALHTTIVFVVICLGILLVQPNDGFMAPITNDSLGGVLARRLLPAAIGVPIILGWLRLIGQREGLYGLAFGVAIRTLSEVIILSALTWWSASKLFQVDTIRKGVEALEQAAQDRLALLAEAGVLLGSSLDYQITLQRLTQLAVTYIADWCTVDMVMKDQSLQRLAATHKDPTKLETVYEIFRLYPPNPDRPYGTYKIIRTGQPELHPVISPDWFDKNIPDEKQRRLSRELNTRSFMQVPLSVRNEIRGVITFVSCRDEVHFGPADLELAQELARRVSVVIDNANLYKEAQKLNAELEQRVMERTAQLTAVNKELEAFSYSVSHDLRAPLRAIDGFSQSLLEDYHAQIDAVGQDYLNRVRAASQRMGLLIDDLLNLSRITRAEFSKKSVNLSSLVQEVAAELCQNQPERAVEFVIQENLNASADPSLLRVALDNLLGNAWKFTRDQKHARIEFGMTKMEDERVYFVRDNGAGFDMAYVEKLFGAFQRLHSMTEFEGTGIGLATTQRIIFGHGGRIWAEGAVQKGATFYFTLG